MNYPLDPLSVDEFTAVAAILQCEHGVMFDPESPVFQRATVIGHTLWVMPNQPDERWPAGEFVNQSSEDTGLAEWTKADRNIENTYVGTPPDTCHTDSTSVGH